LFSARCTAARWLAFLARQRFGARPEERDEKIFADERPQGRGAASHDLRQVSRRPGSPAALRRRPPVELPELEGISTLQGRWNRILGLAMAAWTLPVEDLSLHRLRKFLAFVAAVFHLLIIRIFDTTSP
jgi:hypothetical protein